MDIIVESLFVKSFMADCWDEAAKAALTKADKEIACATVMENYMEYISDCRKRLAAKITVNGFDEEIVNADSYFLRELFISGEG